MFFILCVFVVAFWAIYSKNPKNSNNLSPTTIEKSEAKSQSMEPNVIDKHPVNTAEGKQSFWSKKIVIVIGFLGAIIALTNGLYTIYAVVKNRKPELKAFIPYNFTGYADADKPKPILGLLVRIANERRNSAYLYLETMSIDIKYNNTWHTTEILMTDSKTPFKPQFDETSEYIRFGVNDVGYLNRFADNRITYDKPITGYIIVTYTDREALKGFDKVRVRVRDSHMRLHDMIVDLGKQLKYDPKRK